MSKTQNSNNDDVMDMANRRHVSINREEVSSGSNIWLVSFTDVIALMLTFFVLLYSMSSPDTQKWEYKVGVSLSPVAEYSGPAENAGVNEGQNISRMDYNNAEDRAYVEALLKEILLSSNMAQTVMIKHVGMDVHVVLPKTVLKTNNRDVDSDLSLFYRQLSSVLGSLDNQIMVASQTPAQKKDAAYRELQTIAKTLKNARYKKPITIGLVGNQNAFSNGQVSIVIQPHDGRRITR